MFLAVMIYTCLFLRRFQLEPKGFSRSIEFYKHKMMAVDRCPPPYPLLTWTFMLSLESFSDHFWSFFTPWEEVFGVTIAEVDSGVDDISLLVKRVLLVLVENT